MVGRHSTLWDERMQRYMPFEGRGQLDWVIVLLPHICSLEKVVQYTTGDWREMGTDPSYPSQEFPSSHKVVDIIQQGSSEEWSTVVVEVAVVDVVGQKSMLMMKEQQNTQMKWCGLESQTRSWSERAKAKSYKSSWVKLVLLPSG